MNLSLKERYKFLGKTGEIFLTIYHLILILNIIYIDYYINNFTYMLEWGLDNTYAWNNGITVAFFILFIFNICTLWRLNKLSFWSTIVSIVALITVYVKQMIYILNAIAEHKEFYDYVDFSYSDYILFVVFSSLLVAFLFMFFIFAVIKREVFGFKVISINDLDDSTE
ncbi:MAG TPA: hypothetical protein GX710_08715 [Clostridiales bacterium]|nr:hypothetical protein [Clostridiales bacterium]